MRETAERIITRVPTPHEIYDALSSMSWARRTPTPPCPWLCTTIIVAF